MQAEVHLSSALQATAGRSVSHGAPVLQLEVLLRVLMSYNAGVDRRCGSARQIAGPPPSALERRQRRHRRKHAYAKRESANKMDGSSAASFESWLT